MCNHRDKKTGLSTIIPRGSIFICTQCGAIVNGDKEVTATTEESFMDIWDVIKEVDECSLMKSRLKKS